MTRNSDRTLDSFESFPPVDEGATLFLNRPIAPPREADTLIGMGFEPVTTMALAIRPKPQARPDAPTQAGQATATEGATQFIAGPLALPAGPTRPATRGLPRKTLLAAGLVLALGLGGLLARSQFPTETEVAESPAMVEAPATEALADAVSTTAGASTVARLEVPTDQDLGEAAAASGPLALETRLDEVTEQASAALAGQPTSIGSVGEQDGGLSERLVLTEPATAAEPAAPAPNETAAAPAEPAEQAPADLIAETEQPASVAANEQNAEAGQDEGATAVSLPEQASEEQAAAVMEQLTSPAPSSARSEDDRDRNGRTAISQYAPSGSAASRLFSR
jgi:hypothetical protein